ncbi:MAG TPA: DUF87 domain-containing protein [Longimicrobium sp.]
MNNPYGTPAEQVVAHFRAWELRGRGWQLYPHQVELQPPFRAFPGHYVWQPPFRDDGRRPGFLSLLLQRHTEPAQLLLPEAYEIDPEEPWPEAPEADGGRCTLLILLPEKFELSREAAEQLLLSFCFCAHPVGLELVGTSEEIRLQFTCSDPDLPHVRAQLQTFAPSAAVIEGRDWLDTAWRSSDAGFIVADLGLGREFIRPLKCFRSFAIDPFTSLLGSLSAVASGEAAIVQMLFEPAAAPWVEHILRSVHDDAGDPHELIGRDLSPQAKQKVASPLFACRVRLAVKAAPQRRLALLRGVFSAFAQYNAPLGNELIALDNQGWDEDDQESALLYRQGHRCGMLLNLEELVGLVHLPSSTVSAAKLLRLSRRTKEAPPGVRGRGVFIGENEHHGQKSDIRLPEALRFRHTYVVGGTGTGKSTLLINLILQDLEARNGLAVLDPHGDLVDAILARIPDHRLRDVVLIDPSDTEYTVGLNILSAHSELERTLLSSDLVAVFRRLATSWGDQMTAVFGNAVLAFLESSEGGTLLDLRRFLVDSSFRGSFLRTVSDPEVVYFWTKEFPLLRGNPQAPLLTRLDQFLRPKLIRQMVAQKERNLDFRALMDGRKIILCKLSRGAIGEENAYLLGTLLVAKLQQAASSRQDISEAERSGFFLYLDEFQHFITPSVADLLSGVRKYRMGLVLAHQHLSQLTSRSPELLDAILSAGTRICFQVGDDDAKKLASGFASFEARDLQNLGLGEALVRVERAEHDFNLTTLRVPEVDQRTARARTERVVASSRELFAVKRVEVAASNQEATVIETDAHAAHSEPSPRVPEEKKQERVRKAPAEVPAGRGGAQHKYLQALVRRFGEDRGFKSTVERSVLDGYGSIDVALERQGCRIAVEIAVTTPSAHEVQNIQKCLAAGFDLALLVAADPAAQKRLSANLIQNLSAEARERVRCVIPEELPGLLDSLVVPAEMSETVAGYKVTTSFRSPEAGTKTGAVEAIKEIVGRSLKRKKS